MIIGKQKKIIRTSKLFAILYLEIWPTNASFTMLTKGKSEVFAKF
jgi:hypothetical protein